MDIIPCEINAHIFSFLGRKKVLTLVCKKWCSLIRIYFPPKFDVLIKAISQGNHDRVEFLLKYIDPNIDLNKIILSVLTGPKPNIAGLILKDPRVDIKNFDAVNMLYVMEGFLINFINTPKI